MRFKELAEAGFNGILWFGVIAFLFVAMTAQAQLRPARF